MSSLSIGLSSCQKIISSSQCVSSYITFISAYSQTYGVISHIVMHRYLILKQMQLSGIFWFVAQLYASVILVGLCNNGSIPLFFEMAAEKNYPVSEIVTASMITLMFNVWPIIFLLVFLIPNIGKRVILLS